MLTVIQAAVEGIVDEAVVRRLIAHAGGQVGPVYGKSGKPALRKKIRGYNNAAHFTPWVVLVDLDNDADCARQYAMRGCQYPRLISASELPYVKWRPG